MSRVFLSLSMSFMLLPLVEGGSPPAKERSQVILVYELTKRNGDKAEAEDVDLQKLGEALKRRIDPGSFYRVAVRPVGKNRIEIRLPGDAKGKDPTPQVIQDVKDLLSKAGRLEFRILANSADDKTATEVAKEQIKKAKDLEERATKGWPPPEPRQAGDASKSRVFELRLADDAKSQVTYDWLELGPQERRLLNLDTAAAKDESRNTTWLDATKNLDTAIHLKDLGGRPLLQGALFIVRKTADSKMSDGERRLKAFDLFVLARRPEIDPKTGTASPAIDGSLFLETIKIKNKDKSPVLLFILNDKGADLMRALTRKNAPGKVEKEQDFRRHLAITLDGLVVTAPTISSEFGAKGAITGAFTEKEMDNLVRILQAGALPGNLSPLPVEEKIIPLEKRE